MKRPFAERIVLALSRPEGRALLRMEKSLKRRLMSIFDSMAKRIANAYGSRKGMAIKGIEDNINSDEMDEAITEHVERALLYGGQKRVRKDKLGRLGIKFSLDHPNAKKYLKTDAALRLAQMAETTKESIRPVLAEAMAKGQSVTDLAKSLKESFGFSESRAELISIHEIGDAYEEGNFIPLKEVQDFGYDVFKKWDTVKDENVTPECAENEDAGWIALDDEFPSGDLRPKREGNPRCRCSLLTETKVP